MKRFLTILVFILAVSAARAQSNLLDMLKSAASTAVDKATDGALTTQRIVGKWLYSKPALRLTSDNTLSEIAAVAASSTAEDKMAKYYEMAGIREGAFSFVFNDDGTFTSDIGGKELSGQYSMDGAAHTLTLAFGAGTQDAGNLKGLNASAYIDGSDLQILFAADRLLDALQFLADASGSMQTVTSLLENYDGMMIGFRFTPQQ